jgi:capsular polysaccharide biosynthesis protein
MAQFARRAHVDWSGRTADMVETKWVNDMIPAPFEMTVNELRNCIVTGTGAVTAEGRLVAESSYLLHLMYGRNAIRDGMRQPHHVGHIDGLAILAINSVSFNYYHWLAQIMPFMEIARNIVQQRGDKKITIVTGRTLRFHDEFIKILFEEFENVTVIRLRTGEFVTADSGLYSNVMSDGSPRCIVAEQLYVGQRLKAAFLDRISPASRFLYISRTDTNARRIANEDDLIGYVRARKFEVLTLSQMPVRDQISAFSEARIVLGGHGAGMANILFASSQAHLVELQHSTYVNTCMLRLAQNVGAEHTVKFFFPDESRPSVGGEWDVDLAEIGRLLDRIMP